MKKAQQRAQQNQNGYNSSSEEVPVGKTVIDTSSLKGKNPKKNDDLGEYVDYEEVDS